ncbi:hypothetical protein ABRQ22_17300 [Cellulosimicrobium sp. ES-005]|uniref:Uncharacterized protein n=1 Tax=Cellulosimicrobium sp. ES-005 TaxID=3163031 RepID=A0AAU8G0R6_9MICO
MASLRVVKPGDEAPRKEVPATITEAIEGSARDVLASMRRALAKKLDAGEVSSNAIASAYKELRELDRQIRALDAAEEQEAERDDGNRRPRRSFNASAI